MRTLASSEDADTTTIFANSKTIFIDRNSVLYEIITYGQLNYAMDHKNYYNEIKRKNALVHKSKKMDQK